jgi:isocitrate lyase
MANYIEKTDIDSKRFVTPSSRYAGSAIVYYTDNKLLTFETYKKNKKTIDSTSKNNKYYVVTPGTEYRPDLVAAEAYGSTDFWWKIMEANDIKDIFNFKAGLNIRLPDAILG